MSNPGIILQKSYVEGRAIADIEILVVNPVNFRQIILRKRVQIDTGFDSGVHIRETEAGDLAIIGVKPSLGPLKLAGNVVASGQFCLGYLQKIGDYSLPPPGIEITLVFQGTSSQGLLGLEAIKSWIVTFNGPAQSFKITY
jgi:hypothetical protein